MSAQDQATAPRLVLGSASPRRRDLLAQIGVSPDLIRAADIVVTPLKNELPRAGALRLADDKCAAIAALEDVRPDDLILTADTIVAVGRRMLGKPRDAAEAASFLHLLSGRRHRVITSVVLRKGDKVWSRRVETQVKFKRLSDEEVSAYLRSGEWRGKAGGYAIQGIGAAMVPSISGSYTNVVGLPLTETANLLAGAGWRVSLDGPAA